MDPYYILGNIIKLFFLFTSPVTFVVGIFLFYDVRTFVKLEDYLAKQYLISKGAKKIIINWLEKDRTELQQFLLKRRHILGIICLVNAALAIYTTLVLLKGY